MIAGCVVLVEIIGITVFARKECDTWEERGSRTEPWRTLIFKKWSKGHQVARKEWPARNQQRITSISDKMVNGRSSGIIKPEKVSSDFSKFLPVGFCQNSSHGTEEPEVNREKCRVSEECRQVFQKFGGEEKDGF